MDAVSLAYFGLHWPGHLLSEIVIRKCVILLCKYFCGDLRILSDNRDYTRIAMWMPEIRINSIDLFIPLEISIMMND